MNISARDKKLIIGILIVVVLLAPYFLVVSPLIEDIKTKDKEIAELDKEFDRLTELNERIPEFREGIENYKVSMASKIIKFPANIIQENLILFMRDLEAASTIQLHQVSFQAGTTIPIGVVSTDLSQELGTESGTQEYSGYTTSQVIGYRVSYDDFKYFLDTIETWKDRMTINNITANYNFDAGEVAGNFTINQFAIMGTGGTVEQGITDVLQGSANIFTTPGADWDGWLGDDGIWDDLTNPDGTGEPETTDPGTEEPETTDPGTEEPDDNVSANAGECDVYFMLSQPQAEINAMIMGVTSDDSSSAILTSDKNTSRLSRFTFTQDGGKYYITYKLSYAPKTKEIPVGDEIVLNIYSSSRAGADDIISSSVALANGTDKKVIVNIINDDETNPRIDIREKTPNIEFVYD